MRVLVCGGRDYDDWRAVYAFLDEMDERQRISVVIEGGASGADLHARQWARSRNKQIETYSADWHGQGRKAGPIRNQTMLDKGRPDAVVAFPGGRGTADMMRKAHSAGVRVEEVLTRPCPTAQTNESKSGQTGQGLQREVLKIKASEE